MANRKDIQDVCKLSHVTCYDPKVQKRPFGKNASVYINSHLTLLPTNESQRLQQCARKFKNILLILKTKDIMSGTKSPHKSNSFFVSFF